LGISFNHKSLDKDKFSEKVLLLKALTVLLNSKLTSYFLFLTSISWGIEREQVTPQEMLALPALPFEISKEQVNKLAGKLDEISVLLAKDILTPTDKERIKEIEDEIDNIIYDALNLTERERFLIEDVLNFGLDLFQEGENSSAYQPVTNTELENYLRILCEDINDTLQFSEMHVWANLFEAPIISPLRMIALQFTEEHPAGFVQKIDSQKQINLLVNKIDKYSYEKHSESVYYRKVVKYYEGDIIYILKPDEKRFWSRSQAMQDADDIIVEVSNMQGLV